MKYLFKVNGNHSYEKNPYVEKNTFIGMTPQTDDIPTFDKNKDKLPVPFWEGHEDAVNCYYTTWSIAFGNLKKANPEAGFVSNFIDSAFNDCLFMWDSAFIVMFGKYASRIFDFQRTLDNLYSHQHTDGFICREIFKDINGEMWSHNDPASTGPNVLPWAEWEYFLSTGNVDRLSRVFDPLMGYHRWFRRNRSWQDGSYWACGLSSGMDNQPRVDPQYDEGVSHGFMSWIDACAQQYLSANILIKMAKVLGREDETHWLKEEAELLGNTVNNTMWSEKDSYYYDRKRDGSLTSLKTVGAYWTLIADLVPQSRMDAFVAHLDNEKEFKRPNRVPSISADSPSYDPVRGGYWNGAVWAPTNYMVLCGLAKHGYNRLAHEIAVDYLRNVVEVYNICGTVFENYSPEYVNSGMAMPDFVGWTGLAPISVLFEYVFGIRPDAQNHKITWYINRTERHGIKQYPLGDATVDLECEARSSEDAEPVVHITGDKPVTVEIVWNGKSKIIKA